MGESSRLISDYIVLNLFPSIVSLEAPSAINISLGFRDFMIGRGQTQLNAEERTIKWNEQLIGKLNTTLEEWDKCGVPRPTAFYDPSAPEILLTWCHPKFEILTGFTAPPENFFEIVNWLENLDARKFLIPCVYMLKLAGSDKIYITDGKGDEGIDCIGRVNGGLLRSTAIFMQAKIKEKKGELLSRNLLLAEYGKYLSMPHTDIYQKYRSVLNLDDSADGTNYVYMLSTNALIHESAKAMAAKLGILLRSKWQIAYMLATHTTLECIKITEKNLENKLSKNLNHNLVNEIIF